MHTIFDHSQHFVEELAILQTISSYEHFPLCIEDEFGKVIKGKIHIKEGKYFLELPVRLSTGRITIRFSELLSVKASVHLKDISVSIFPEKSEEKFVYSILTMENGNVKEDGWCQCFLPVSRENLLFLLHHFRKMFSLSESNKYLNPYFQVDNSPYPFFIFCLNNGSRNYLLIKTNEGLPFCEFKEYCDIILSTISFVTGIFPGGDIVYFTGHQGFFRTYTERSPGYFPHFQLHPGVDFSLSDFNVPDNTCFSGKDLGSLVSAFYSERSFYFIFTLLLECITSCSGILKPGMLAVIMESLSKLICKEEEGKVRPLKNQKVFRDIKMTFYDLLSTYRDDFETEEEYIKFKRRISELNKPVNKQFLTNTEKLLQPFEQLGIMLTLEDREIIEHRNDLLHGTFHLPDESGIAVEMDYVDHVSARLYTLTSALILKYTGYRGYIVNHSVFLKKIRMIKTDELPYRWI
ncbi:MAG: hypothetical protein LUG98_09710 [Tannerellaceae bacterium]|nr:hypothetical protein [Tannerellaceae bacterium]